MDRKVLLVEDEERVREITSDYFKASGFTVYEAADGEIALDVLAKTRMDLIILDIMMPRMDGWSLCKRIRKTSDVPVIMLTARGDEDDKLMGFELGADEYVTKPFSPKVLVARAITLLKRSEGSICNNSSVLEVAGIEINRDSHIVQINREFIDLTPKEYSLLIYLVENRRVVLSREKILDRVWGYDYFGDLRVVDTHIKNLRRKLKDKAECIHTVIKSGYKFEEV